MIDYNQPWQELNIDVSKALSKDFDAEKFRLNSDQADRPVATWAFRGVEILEVLDKSWLEYLDQLGIKASLVTIFYRDAYYVHPEAHVDVFRDKDNPTICTPSICALNLVFSPQDDSFMTWYDLPFETSVMPTSSLYHSLSPTPAWKLQDIKHKEFARHTIGNKLTLVRTGIAHNVIVNKQPRWAFSLRTKPNLNITDWKSAVDYYANTIGLIKT